MRHEAVQEKQGAGRGGDETSGKWRQGRVGGEAEKGGEGTSGKWGARRRGKRGQGKVHEEIGARRRGVECGRSLSGFRREGRAKEE